MNEEKIEEILLQKLLQQKVNVLGPIALKFEESKKEARMKEKSYFTDTTMNGNTAHFIFLRLYPFSIKSNSKKSLYN